MRVFRAEVLSGLLIVLSSASVEAELEFDPAISTGLSGNAETVSGFFSPSLSLEYRHPVVDLLSDVSGIWTADTDQSFALESWESQNRLVFFADSPFYRLDLYQIHNQTDDLLNDTELVRDSFGVGISLEQPLAETVRQGVSVDWDYTQVTTAPQPDTSIHRLDGAYQLLWQVTPRQTQAIVISGRLTDADQQTMRLGWQGGYRFAETDLSAGLDYSMTQAPEGDDEGVEGRLGLVRPVWIGSLNLEWRRSFVDSVTALTIAGVGTEVSQTGLVEVNQVTIDLSEVSTGDRSQASVSFRETQTRSRVSVEQISERRLGRSRQISLDWELQGRSDTAYGLGHSYQQDENNDNHESRVTYQTRLNSQLSFDASASYRWQSSEDTYEWRLGLIYQPSD